ncbi:hypothetical protein [Massilia sp. 9096]|uniref:hypothetical protein n=1 Tax=Massilia sp. 9096 TaxID=1500894 RepID=UPI00056B6CA8|nr:hypothetical protein [Massilia sp. 9096]
MYSKIVTTLFSAAVLACISLPNAQAQSETIQDMTGSNACLQSANFPAPFGESDLKGNAKLPAYCDCYMSKFEARRIKAAQAMQANTDTQANLDKAAKKKKRAEAYAEQLAMRNSCRQQLGLPPAADASK